MDALGQGRDDDIDESVGAVEAAPQIVVLPVGAAEEGAEAVELDALQGRLGAALADGGGVVGGDAVDLDRIELVQTLALEERKGRDIVEGESQIGQDERSALSLGGGRENLRNARVGLVVAAYEVEDRKSTRLNSSH